MTTDHWLFTIVCWIRTDVTRYSNSQPVFTFFKYYVQYFGPVFMMTLKVLMTIKPTYKKYHFETKVSAEKKWADEVFSCILDVVLDLLILSSTWYDEACEWEEQTQRSKKENEWETGRKEEGERERERHWWLRLTIGNRLVFGLLSPNRIDGTHAYIQEMTGWWLLVLSMHLFIHLSLYLSLYLFFFWVVPFLLFLSDKLTSSGTTMTRATCHGYILCNDSWVEKSTGVLNGEVKEVDKIYRMDAETDAREIEEKKKKKMTNSREKYMGDKVRIALPMCSWPSSE